MMKTKHKRNVSYLILKLLKLVLSSQFNCSKFTFIVISHSNKHQSNNLNIRSKLKLSCSIDTATSYNSVKKHQHKDKFQLYLAGRVRVVSCLPYFARNSCHQQSRCYKYKREWSGVTETRQGVRVEYCESVGTRK